MKTNITQLFNVFRSNIEQNDRHKIRKRAFLFILFLFLITEFEILCFSQMCKNKTKPLEKTIKK